jgi:hypothetical protein
MSMSTEASVSRGRALAFRIVGWILGVLTVGYGLFFVLTSIVSDDPGDAIHRFHNLGGFAGQGLIGVFSILFVTRPALLSAFHALVAQASAWVIAGLMGGDLFSGGYITALIGLILLSVLHPDRASLLRLPGRPSIALLSYALLVTIPAWIYAVQMAELQHGPSSDPHVEFHHWSGMAVAGLAIAGTAIASSLRGSGWTITAAIASIAAVLFGVAGLAFADYAGAPGIGWSWVAIAAGLGFLLLSRIELARERMVA